MIGTRPIESHPKLITFACTRRTDVGVRVMSVNAPRRENPFRESIFTGSPHVIHDLALAIFNDRLANPRSEIVKHCVPTDAFPFSFAAFPDTLERVKNPIRIVNLVQR